MNQTKHTHMVQLPAVKDFVQKFRMFVLNVVFFSLFFFLFFWGGGGNLQVCFFDLFLSFRSCILL